MARAAADRPIVEVAEQAAQRVQRVTVRELFPPRVALARGRGAVVVTGLALAAFAVLFALVRARQSDDVDRQVTRALQRQRQPLVRRLMELVSWPGFPPQSRLLPPALAFVWLVLGFPLEAAFQGLAWGTGFISFAVKRVMRRPRPAGPDITVAIARIGGSSFPSGHVLNYLGVYGFLAYLLDSMLRPAKLRRIAVGGLTALLALVGPSRIYLGHHWATDVTASYLLGTSYLLGLTALYRRAKVWQLRRRTNR